jgi:uncharacterized protein (TIGR02611 family)
MTARPSLPLHSSAVSHRPPGPSGASATTPLKRWARKAGITVAGIGLLAGGAVMLVLPGPGLAAILLGLAVLATEYAWAARLLARLRQYTSRVTGPVAARMRRRRQAAAAG